MKKIHINVPQNDYNVFLGKNIIDSFPKLLIKENLSGNLFFVIDKNVNKFYSKILSDVFANINFNYNSIVVNANEKNKSYETLQKIHNALIKHNYGRDSIIVAVGGGIVGDVTGFAASTYMRGIKYIQIPTTLLASVDSSVGGKTGINFNDTKNIIGTFYQPKMVLIDTNFFSTLPQEEMLCGVGEIIKYCFLTEPKFFNYIQKNITKLLSNETSVITKVIAESIKFKGDVVTEDEKESGIRKILNLGHTFAHAYEVEQNHKIKHGQAVIIGIASALYLSKNLSLLPKEKFDKYINLLLQFKSAIKLKKVNKNLAYKVMQRDKKNRDNQIKLVLLKDVGNIITDISVSKKRIIDAIEFGVNTFSK